MSSFKTKNTAVPLDPRESHVQALLDPRSADAQHNALAVDNKVVRNHDDAQLRDVGDYSQVYGGEYTSWIKLFKECVWVDVLPMHLGSCTQWRRLK